MYPTLNLWHKASNQALNNDASNKGISALVPSMTQIPLISRNYNLKPNTHDIVTPYMDNDIFLLCYLMASDK